MNKQTTKADEQAAQEGIELSPTDAMIGMPPMGWADGKDVISVVRQIHRARRQTETRKTTTDGDL